MKISVTRRVLGLLLGAVLPAALAGCGGGGGVVRPTPTPGPTPLPTATPIPVPVFSPIWSDEFTGAALDSGRWNTFGPAQEIQLTRFGLEPEITSENGDSFARLRLESFDPNRPGERFVSTEMFSRQKLARGRGLEVEARVRGSNVPPGVLFAFFLIDVRFEGTPSFESLRKTEIDFEFLGSEQERFSPSGQRNRLYLNVWDDWNEVRDGFDLDEDETPGRLTDDMTYKRSIDPNFDWANWNVYTVRWLEDRTEFLVNGRLERVEREVLPRQDMTVNFNLWSSDPSFRQAFSPSFVPADRAEDNQIAWFDVDYVRVRGAGNNVPSDSARASRAGDWASVLSSLGARRR